MSENLTDPNKPPHAVVETDEHGRVKQNDGTALTPANANPWYVLATVYGEQQSGPHSDDDLHAKNRRIWNGWMCAALDASARQKLAEQLKCDVAELAPLKDQEREDLDAEFNTRLPDSEGPDPKAAINFNRTYFETYTRFDGFVFPVYADFQAATFSDMADFKAATFSDRAVFEATTFSSLANFSDGTFSNLANFSDGTFSGWAIFESATFRDNAYFRSANFSDWAYFRSANFSDMADFEAAIFRGLADFEAATFLGRAIFSGRMIFSEKAIFKAAIFRGLADFDSATFSRRAVFDSATFSGKADFDSATFSGGANFSDGAFQGTTDFKNARFEEHVPKFFQRELHQDTVFTIEDANWPDITSKNADDGKRAYTRLRQLMHELHKPDDAHFFFRQEMRCKAELEGPPDSWVIGLYGLIAGFGYSVTRPACWLLGMWFVPALIYVDAFDCTDRFGAEHITEATPFGLSFTNLFAFFGLNRVFFGTVIGDFGPWLSFLAGFQTVTGFILAFFLGLGLRNRFRLK